MIRHSKAVIRTARWRRLRLLALRRDGFACVQCGSRLDLEVDHITPVRDAPELSYSLENLQVLCVSCHSRKTRGEIGLPKPNEEAAKWRKLFEKKPKID